MKLGISLYPGLDADRAKSLLLLQKAAALGYSRVFSSLHIPESNAVSLREDALYLFACAESLGLDVIADISPLTLKILDIPELTPARLKQLHITTARFDYGIGTETIAAFSREMNVQLNASTARSVELHALLKAEADFSRIDGQHNFYPRPHTGLSGAFVKKQNDLLHAFGIPVGAFLPSRAGRRGPLQEGLPTVEGDRELPLELGADRLLLLGTDFIQIGDDRPDAQELAALGQFSDALILPLRAEKITTLHAKLMEHVYTTRADMAEEVIRMADSRAQWKACRPIPAWEAEPLPQGAVTLDNEQYGRYAGEVEICLRDLPADGRVDLLGRVAPEARFLLPLIGPGQKIQFRCEAGAQAGAR